MYVSHSIKAAVCHRCVIEFTFISTHNTDRELSTIDCAKYDRRK